MPRDPEEFRRVVLNDATVYQVLKSGGDVFDACVCLAKEKQDLLRRLQHAESIAPRKIRLANGEFAVFQVPSELIPEMRI